jgi:hypothetical protein
MTAIAALIYGFLASFVLSAAGHNQRKQQAHSAALLRAGYLLCGLSAGMSVILTCVAVQQFV